MEIYIACFAGLLSSMLLAVVYLADRYEPEPIELIQDSFLTGLASQLVLIFAASSFGGEVLWSGRWMLITVVCAAVYLPFRFHREAEVDERFDGIVYSVALIGGAACAVHLNNLPRVMAASPYRAALAPGAEPDLRDLLILAGSPGLMAELGQGLVVIAAAVFVGATLGTLQLRGSSPWRTAAVCTVVGLTTVGLDLLLGGGLWLRVAMALAAIAVGFVIKRRSVHRVHPEPPEKEVLAMGLKTVLVILGAALLATVLLQAAVEQHEVGEDSMGEHHQAAGPRAGPES